MDNQSPAPLVDDQAFPIGFVIVPTFICALLWLVAMLGRV